MGLRYMGDDYVPPMTPQEAIQVHQEQCASLEVKTRQVCADCWSILPEDADKRAAFLEQVLTETIGTLGDISAELAAQHVKVYRAAHGYEPGPVETSNRESQETIRYICDEIERDLEQKGEKEAFARFERRAVASVLGRSRNTVVNSAHAAGTRWCRVPERGACWFCLMLASRGAVYSSKDTAKGTTGRYHAHCRCTAAEVLGDRLPDATAACVKWYEQHGSFDREHVESGEFTATTGIISTSVEESHNARLGRSRVPADFEPTVMDENASKAVWPDPTDEDMQVVFTGKPARKPGKWHGGHLHGAGIPGKTEFPESWDEDDIYRATMLTMLDPQLAQIDGDRRTYRRDVHGVIVEVSWYLNEKTGKMVYRHTIPRAGDGVYENDDDGHPAEERAYSLDYLTHRIRT